LEHEFNLNNILNLIFTSHKTQYILITNTSQLMLFREIIDVYSENHAEQIQGCVGFEVHTAVVMKAAIFWDITPRSPLKVSRRFGGTHMEEGAHGRV
jgi:hypothetical protein